MEKEEKLKVVRKKEQAAKLDRVRFLLPKLVAKKLISLYRKRKRLELHRRGKRRNGKKTMHMMSFSKRVIQMRQIIKIEGKIGRTISCRLARYFSIT
jgi:hypothetical protein